jgi:phosphoserine aminotransferase
MSEQEQRNFIKEIATILDEENVAFDIRGHMAAPPNIRLWCGPTIESSDIKLLLTWLDFAFNEVLQKLLLKSHF